MVDVSIVILLSKLEWIGRQAGRRTDGQDHVLSQADALTKKQGNNLWKNLNMSHYLKTSYWSKLQRKKLFRHIFLFKLEQNFKEVYIWH